MKIKVLGGLFVTIILVVALFFARNAAGRKGFSITHDGATVSEASSRMVLWPMSMFIDDGVLSVDDRTGSYILRQGNTRLPLKTGFEGDYDNLQHCMNRQVFLDGTLTSDLSGSIFISRIHAMTTVASNPNDRDLCYASREYMEFVDLDQGDLRN